MLNQPIPDPFNAPIDVKYSKVSQNKKGDVGKKSSAKTLLNKPLNEAMANLKGRENAKVVLTVKDEDEVIHELIVTVTEGKIESIKDKVTGAAVASTLSSPEITFSAAGKVSIIAYEETQQFMDIEFDEKVEFDVLKIKYFIDEEDNVEHIDHEHTTLVEELEAIEEVLEDIDKIVELVEVPFTLLEIAIEKSELLETVADIELPYSPDEVIETMGLEAITDTLKIADVLLKSGILIKSGVQAGKKGFDQVKYAPLKMRRSSLRKEKKDLKKKLADQLEIKFGKLESEGSKKLKPGSLEYKTFESLAKGLATLEKYSGNDENIIKKLKNNTSKIRGELVKKFGNEFVDQFTEYMKCKLDIETLATAKIKLEKYEGDDEDYISKLETNIEELEDKLNKNFGKDLVKVFTDYSICKLTLEQVDSVLKEVEAETKHAYRHFAMNSLKEGKAIAQLAGKKVISKIINIPIQTYKIIKNTKDTYKLAKLARKCNQGIKGLHNKRIDDLSKFEKKKADGELTRSKLELEGIKVGKSNLLGLKQNSLKSKSDRITFGAIMKVAGIVKAGVVLAVTPFGIAAGLAALGIISVGFTVSAIATGGTILAGIIGLGLLTALVTYLIWKNKEKIKFFFETKYNEIKLRNKPEELEKFKKENKKHKQLLKISQELDMSPKKLNSLLESITNTNLKPKPSNEEDEQVVESQKEQIAATRKEERKEIAALLGDNQFWHYSEEKQRDTILNWVFKQ